MFCPRCYETFSTEIVLHAHQRADDPCPKRPEEAIEGFDAAQERNLKSRKKAKPELSEEDKWKEMYRILFPDDDESSIPYPYLDCDWEKIYQKGRVSGSNEVARYEQFLRRELPAAVRRELEVAAEAELTPMEERLKSRLIDIVRDVQLQLFQAYAHSRGVPKAPAHSEVIDSTHADSIVEGAHGPGSMHPELMNELASFEPAPPIETADLDSFDAILFKFDDLENFDDSAYGSFFDTGFPGSDWGDSQQRFYDPNSDNGEGSSRSAL